MFLVDKVNFQNNTRSVINEDDAALLFGWFNSIVNKDTANKNFITGLETYILNNTVQHTLSIPYVSTTPIPIIMSVPYTNTMSKIVKYKDSDDVLHDLDCYFNDFNTPLEPGTLEADLAYIIFLDLPNDRALVTYLTSEVKDNTDYNFLGKIVGWGKLRENLIFKKTITVEENKYFKLSTGSSFRTITYIESEDRSLNLILITNKDGEYSVCSDTDGDTSLVKGIFKGTNNDISFMANRNMKCMLVSYVEENNDVHADIFMETIAPNTIPPTILFNNLYRRHGENYVRQLVNTTKTAPALSFMGLESDAMGTKLNTDFYFGMEYQPNMIRITGYNGDVTTYTGVEIGTFINDVSLADTEPKYLDLKDRNIDLMRDREYKGYCRSVGKNIGQTSFSAVTYKDTFITVAGLAVAKPDLFGFINTEKDLSNIATDKTKYGMLMPESGYYMSNYVRDNTNTIVHDYKVKFGSTYEHDIPLGPSRTIAPEEQDFTTVNDDKSIFGMDINPTVSIDNTWFGALPFSGVPALNISPVKFNMVSVLYNNGYITNPISINDTTIIAPMLKGMMYGTFYNGTYLIKFRVGSSLISVTSYNSPNIQITVNEDFAQDGGIRTLFICVQSGSSVIIKMIEMEWDGVNIVVKHISDPIPNTSEKRFYGIGRDMVAYKTTRATEKGFDVYTTSGIKYINTPTECIHIQRAGRFDYYVVDIYNNIFKCGVDRPASEAKFIGTVLRRGVCLDGYNPNRNYTGIADTSITENIGTKIDLFTSFLSCELEEEQYQGTTNVTI